MLETAREQAFPWLQQISFFLPNRVGSLQRVVNVLGEAGVRICGLSILDAHDHAVVRMVVDKPDKAVETLGQGGRSVCTAKLLGVSVPGDDRDAVGNLLARLLRAELNVYYAYALLVRHAGEPVIALYADDTDTAAQVLRAGNFALVAQRDLVSDDDDEMATG